MMPLALILSTGVLTGRGKMGTTEKLLRATARSSFDRINNTAEATAQKLGLRIIEGVVEYKETNDSGYAALAPLLIGEAEMANVSSPDIVPVVRRRICNFLHDSPPALAAFITSDAIDNIQDGVYADALVFAAVAQMCHQDIYLIYSDGEVVAFPVNEQCRSKSAPAAFMAWVVGNSVPLYAPLAVRLDKSIAVSHERGGGWGVAGRCVQTLLAGESGRSLTLRSV